MSSTNPILTADLLQESVAVTLPGGEVKNMKYVDFLNLIQQHTGTLEQEQSNRGDAVVMPGYVRFFQKDANSIKVVLYIPEQKRDLYWGGPDNVYENCCLPNVVIAVQLTRSRSRGAPANSWNIDSLNWFCTDLSFDNTPDNWSHLNNRNSDRHMWTLPVPNMYEGGNMCTGDNMLPSVRGTDLRVLGALYEDVLVRGYFNNDLSVRGIRVSLSNRDSLRLYRECERFPYEILHGHHSPSRVLGDQSISQIAKMTRQFPEYHANINYGDWRP